MKATNQVQSIVQSNSSSNSTAAVVHSSIFDRDDFQLNLSRKPEDQV